NGSRICCKLPSCTRSSTFTKTRQPPSAASEYARPEPSGRILPFDQFPSCFRTKTRNKCAQVQGYLVHFCQCLSNNGVPTRPSGLCPNGCRTCTRGCVCRPR